MENKCAFDLEDRCSALSEMRCEGCSFYKTKAELVEGRRKAKERLFELAQSEYRSIQDKYYHDPKARKSYGG